MLRKKHLGKKAIMYEFIVRLVLALVMVVAAVYIGSSFFRLSDEASNSYSNLVSEIRDIKDGELRSISLVMDKSTAIFGINKNSSEIIRASNNTLNTLNTLFDSSKECQDNPSCQSFIKRPASCEIGKSCICYCLDYDAIMSITGRAGSGYEGVCKKIMCDTFDDISFVDPISELKLAYYQESLIAQIPYPSLIYNGFAIERIKTASADWPIIQGILTQYNLPPRTRSVYIERYKNNIGICMDAPCISKEQKQKIDQTSLK